MKKKKAAKPKKKSMALPTHPKFVEEHRKLFEIDINKDNKKWNKQFRKVQKLAKRYEDK